MKKEIVEIDGKYAARVTPNAFTGCKYISTDGNTTYGAISNVLDFCLHESIEGAEESLERYFRFKNPKVVKNVK